MTCAWTSLQGKNDAESWLLPRTKQMPAQKDVSFQPPGCSCKGVSGTGDQTSNIRQCSSYVYFLVKFGGIHPDPPASIITVTNGRRHCRESGTICSSLRLRRHHVASISQGSLGPSSTSTNPTGPCQYSTQSSPPPAHGGDSAICPRPKSYQSPRPGCCASPTSRPNAALARPALWCPVAAMAAALPRSKPRPGSFHKQSQCAAGFPCRAIHALFVVHLSVLFGDTSEQRD